MIALGYAYGQKHVKKLLYKSSRKTRNFLIQNHRTIMNSIWIPKLSSTLKFDLGGLDETPHALLFRQARYATVIQVMLDFGGIISNEDYC